LLNHPHSGAFNTAVPQEFKVIASVYRSLVSILKESGLTAAAISDQVGVDVDQLSAPQTNLDLRTVTALWELGHQTRGPMIGIEAAQRIRLVDFQDVGVFLTATENIVDLMSQLDRYSRLFSNVMDYRSVLTPLGLEVSVLYHPDVSLKHERLEFLALAGPVLASQYLATPLRIASVELTRPRPDQPQPWDDAFGVAVCWRAPITRYVIAVEEAQRAVLTRNEQVKRDLQLLLDQRLRDNQQQSPLDDIRIVMAKQIAHQVPSVESVASALHISARTLQRRIAQAGSSFSGLLAELREQVSMRYLGLGVTPEHVAERLGYADLPTFSRAFKRWAGMTPSQYAEHMTIRNKPLGRSLLDSTE